MIRLFELLLLAACWLGTPVSAWALRVCADPDYMPYSNRAGEGFENKIAVAAAKALGESVEYTWASQRGRGGFSQFLSSTLDAKKCDVVMSLPYGSREELTTKPYYISSYVVVFSKDKNYSLTSMDSPVLKGLAIGYEADTPVEGALKIRGMIPGKHTVFYVGEEEDQSPAIMVNAVKSGKIDVLITWLPAVGAFLQAETGLSVVAVPNARIMGAPEQFTFPMSMAVRQGDEALKKRLDEVIDQHEAEMQSILKQQGVVLP